ncbi:MAG: DUF1552 domain-containing protein [Myxococcota bacterium]
MRRRDLLKMGAASLLAAPFLSLAMGARAQDQGAPRRLLIVHSPNGTIPHRLGATGGNRLAFDAGSILEPLAGLEDQLLVLSNMNFSVGTNHEGGMRAMLTAGGGTSLDQLVGAHLGGSARFDALTLGALTSLWGGSVQTRASYKDGATVTPDDSPEHAWKQLFGDVGDVSLKDRRQSIIDLARGEVTTLRGRLGTQHRAQLDTHLEGLRAAERALSGGGSCESPVAPGVFPKGANDSFPHIADAQLALAVQALACGATNVATVQLTHTVSPVVFTWLGKTESHHALSHAGDGDRAGVQSFVDCERWFAERVATLIRHLANTPDPLGEGSMLDSTVVLWAKEMGDSRAHVCDGVPWVIAGGGETFRLGRQLDMGGATHDGVLAAIANRFGLGLTRFGTGSAAPSEVL